MNRVWMVVEDNAAVRSMLKLLLTHWGVDGLIFEDGDEAWSWLDQVEQGSYAGPLPEVVLLDNMMPGHSGQEVGERLRAISATNGIPQIVMTAYHLSIEDRAEIEDAAHPEHFITKPFPALDDFRALIEQTIQASQPAQQILPAFNVGDMTQAHS